MTTLDRMALFGAGLADATRLYPLSVAYLSLTIAAATDFGPADRIEHVLPQARRILLRGEAGSGQDDHAAVAGPEVQEWLAELVGTFPRVRYVVTTRPAAVAPDWMAAQDFIEVRLQPMTPRDVRTFVPRRHAAMPGQALDDQRDALIAAIGSRSALRRLAENPAAVRIAPRGQRAPAGQSDGVVRSCVAHAARQPRHRTADHPRNPPFGDRKAKSLTVRDVAGYDLPALAGTSLKHLTLDGEPDAPSMEGMPDTPSVDIGPLADVPGLVGPVPHAVPERRDGLVLFRRSAGTEFRPVP
ncbi:hypothetical protein AB0L41_46280 [Amycolatopsis mediterranei]|uniref:hypothetical protein n=1 Tax=Amycolatopsis mediterranei TaxID=33910 RepID=UPI00344A181D